MNKQTSQISKAARSKFKQRQQYNNYKAFVIAGRDKDTKHAEHTKRNYNG